jgi:hypothetical protein
MQTLRKLPTMEPSENMTTDQKWKGTAAQYCGSRMALSMEILKVVERTSP